MALETIYDTPNGKHVISIDQWERPAIQRLFEESRRVQALDSTLEGRRILSGWLKGFRMVGIFYEASTRTSTSFAQGARALGADIENITDVQFSSVSKGETLEDTVRALNRYSDLAVMRHPEKGALARAATVSRTPIINAGDGIGEHPTQALLDAYTIFRHRPIDGLRLTFVGDLKNGRTVHSLARLASKFSGVILNYVSPPQLQMPEELIEQLSNSGVTQNAFTALNGVLENTDVLYVTRVQKERFDKGFFGRRQYNKLKGRYVIGSKQIEQLPEDALLMHPLPRIDEISIEVDSDTRAKYFEQMENGMKVRMALMSAVLGKPFTVSAIQEAMNDQSGKMV